MKEELPGRPFIEPIKEDTRNPFANFMAKIINMIDGPCAWFRAKHFTDYLCFVCLSLPVSLKLHDELLLTVWESIVIIHWNTFSNQKKWNTETVVLPNQKHYPYYHRQYRRVPSVDECYEDDALCMYEANEQFKRDKNVEATILNILNRRKTECVRYEGHERHERCKQIFDDYDKASLNYFIKYGDLGAFPHVKYAYMKQKHRMIYERRKAAGTWDPNP